jgi:hypothetical protein
VAVLGWRIVVARRNEAKKYVFLSLLTIPHSRTAFPRLASHPLIVLTIPDFSSTLRRIDDSLTALFNGAVATSALIGLSSAGSAICACFLERPRIYLLSSLFLNIYPQMAAISCIFALKQRHVLRRKMSSAHSGQQEAAEAEALRVARKTGKTVDNPGLWRGDKISLGPGLSPSAFLSFASLDTVSNADEVLLSRLRPEETETVAVGRGDQLS